MKRTWLILLGGLAFAPLLFGATATEPSGSSTRQFDFHRAQDLLRRGKTQETDRFERSATDTTTQQGDMVGAVAADSYNNSERQYDFFRAQDLLSQGKTQEAYDRFERLAAGMTAEQGDMIGANAELALGRIEMQRANPDEALKHLLKALEWTRLGKEQAEAEGAPAAVAWSVCTDGLIVYQNICNVLIEQGKMAEAREYMKELDVLLEQRAKFEAALGPQLEELAADDDAGRYLEPMNRAMVWAAAGDVEKARELDRRLEREAEKNGRRFVRISALHALMGDACLFERNDEALALAEEAADVPMDTNADATAAAVWYEVAAQRAYLRMVKDGDTEKALQDVRQAVDNLESNRCVLEWLSAGTFESLILKQAGQTNEAVERIDEIADAARQFGFEKLRATALITRAEMTNCEGDESIGAGLIKALDITRRLGIKPWEAMIYLRYGSWLLQRGDFDLAVQTLEQGFSQSEGLGLFHISFRFLLALAEAQQEGGTPEALRSAWVRIERYALEHRDLPPSALKDLEQARSERRVDEPQEESQAAEPVAVAEAHPVPSPAGVSGVASDADVSPRVYDGGAADPVFLAPREVHTCLSSGEVARARILVVNPSGHQIRGSLDVISDRPGCEWEPVDAAWHVLLDSAGASAAATQEVEVPPGGSTLVVMEATPGTNAPQATAILRWNGGRAETCWYFAFSNDTRSVAVVNASLVEENPFYIVPFYHDIYCRDGLDAPQDIRVKTSKPCRVELVDDRTGKIFAIDATGDGAYDGVGDDVLCDANGNSLPDIACGTDGGAVVRVLVIPDAADQAKPGEITIDVAVWDGAQWQSQAEDILVLRDTASPR